MRRVFLKFMWNFNKVGEEMGGVAYRVFGVRFVRLSLVLVGWGGVWCCRW